MKTDICGTPECGNIIAAHNKSGLCARCNSSRYYWSHLPADNVTRRLDQLSFFSTRLTFFAKEGLLLKVRRQKQRRRRRK